AAEHAVERIDDHAYVVAGEAVIDGLAVAPRVHEAVSAQPGKLLRDRRLAQREQLLKLGHRLLALAQYAQDQQSALVRERLQEVARLLGPCRHDLKGGKLAPFRNGRRNAHGVNPLDAMARL